MNLTASDPHDNAARPLDDDIVGVALSGGGVRAALFCSGALAAVLEHATALGKRLRISTVSGSALLALELAWSHAATDGEALRQVQTRVKKYAYWPRPSSWVVGSALALLSALAYLLWYDHRMSSTATATAVSAALTLVVVGAMIVAAVRTLGILYRTQLIAPSWRPPRKPTIYTAEPGHFPNADGRMLTLENVVFNATSLTTGDYDSFDRARLPTTGAVRRFAEASAAFPGVFLPRPLPEQTGLFADGGIYDNTGLTYFKRTQRRPRHVVVVDAGVSPAPPKRLPYALLTGLASRTPKVFGFGAAVVIVGSLLGTLTHVGWLPSVLAGVLLLAVLLAMLAAPLTAMEGAWSDLRWLGRGWPTTLRVASDLHLAGFRTEHESRGGCVTVVRLADALPGARTTTQLWKLPTAEADALISAGYEHTKAQLVSLVLDPSTVPAAPQISGRTNQLGTQDLPKTRQTARDS